MRLVYLRDGVNLAVECSAAARNPNGLLAVPVRNLGAKGSVVILDVRGFPIALGRRFLNRVLRRGCFIGDGLSRRGNQGCCAAGGGNSFEESSAFLRKVMIVMHLFFPYIM